MSLDPRMPVTSSTPRWPPAVAVGLAAAAALALMLGTTDGSGWRGSVDGAPPPAAAPADRAPAPVPAGDVRPGGSTAPPTSAPAPMSSAPTAPAVLAQARPDPFVHDFATGTAGGAAPPLPSPNAPITMAPGVYGCDYGYGEVTQCVPWQFPPGVTDGCAWLLDRDYGPLEVHGDDRHNLDRNDDGIACGPGD